MDALVAVLGCSLMMVVAIAVLAWYALQGRPATDRAEEAAALRAELAELRQRHPEALSDGPTERG